MLPLLVGVLVFASSTHAISSVSYDSKYAVSCSQGNCPPSVAAFISEAKNSSKPTEPAGFLQCSATLIDAQHVLTNAHCLPEEIRHVGASCLVTTEILFPKLDSGPDDSRHACDQVVALSPVTTAEEPTGLDWAIVRLVKPSERRPDPLSSDPLSFDEELTGFTANYNFFFPIVDLQEIKCRSEDLAYLNPLSFDPWSAEFFATECSHKIIHGNSGAAFFNGRGALVALLKAFSHHKTNSENRASLDTTSAVGTKAVCIGENAEKNPLCNWNPQESSFKKIGVELSTLRAFLKAQRQVGLPIHQSSRFVRYGMPTDDLFIELYSKMYPYGHFGAATKELRDRGAHTQASALISLARKSLPRVPLCIRSLAPRDRISMDKIPYWILNFHDVTAYPSDSGQLYLSLNENYTLNLTVHPVEIEVRIEYVEAKDLYRLSHVNNGGQFALSSEEESTFQSLCLREAQQRKAECQADQSCDLSSIDLGTPSRLCQGLFKKRSLDHYLPSFELFLPGCLSTPKR